MRIIATLLLLGLLEGCVVFERQHFSGPVFSDGKSAILDNGLLFELPGLDMYVTVLNRETTVSIIGPLILPPIIPFFLNDEPESSLEISFIFRPEKIQLYKDLGEGVGQNAKGPYSFEPMRVVLLRQDGTRMEPDGVFMPKEIGPNLCTHKNEIEKTSQQVSIIGNACFRILFSPYTGFQEPLTLVIDGVKFSGKRVRFQNIQFEGTKVWKGFTFP